MRTLLLLLAALLICQGCASVKQNRKVRRELTAQYVEDYNLIAQEEARMYGGTPMVLTVNEDGFAAGVDIGAWKGFIEDPWGALVAAVKDGTVFAALAFAIDWADGELNSDKHTTILSTSDRSTLEVGGGSQVTIKSSISELPNTRVTGNSSLTIEGRTANQ